MTTRDIFDASELGSDLSSNSRTGVANCEIFGPWRNLPIGKLIPKLDSKRFISSIAIKESSPIVVSGVARSILSAVVPKT